MSKSIGIDLGTTNSVATWAQVTSALPIVIQNREKEELTPSVVSLKKDQLIIGGMATDFWKQAPKDTIFSIKRLMGRAYSDENVQHAKKNVMYEIVSPANGTDDDIRVKMGGKEYSPIQVSAIILKKVKEDTEYRLKEDYPDKGDSTVDSAVITVPAYFTDKQKDATRKAAKLAGIKVKHILDEPSAAAIAFGFDNVASDDGRTILVYDLGGGTFDVSVLHAAGGTYAQLDIEGDMWLGGDDFDNKICLRILDRVQDEYSIDGRSNVQFMVELKRAAEKAKKILSSTHTATIYIPGELKDGDGDLIDVEMNLSRSEFEQLIEPEIKRSIEIVKTALKNAHLTKDEIDSVLLVGGSSTIPMVRQALVDFFGENKVLANIDPMRCVAQGAGILANKLGDSIKCFNCNAMNPLESTVCQTCQKPIEVKIEEICEQTPKHYGIETEGDTFSVIIPKGTTFPLYEPEIKTFYTVSSNMRRLKVRVFAGMEEKASENEIQLTAWLRLPPGVPANTPVDVAFKLDNQGCINTVKVVLKDGSGRSVEVYPDRGSEKRSKLEKELEQLQIKIDKIRNIAENEKIDECEKMVDMIADNLNSNNIDSAEKMVNELSIQIPRPSNNETVEWRRKADTSISC